jgi:hypothetical protein
VRELDSRVGVALSAASFSKACASTKARWRYSESCCATRVSCSSAPRSWAAARSRAALELHTASCTQPALHEASPYWRSVCHSFSAGGAMSGMSGSAGRAAGGGGGAARSRSGPGITNGAPSPAPVQTVVSRNFEPFVRGSVDQSQSQ